MMMNKLHNQLPSTLGKRIQLGHVVSDLEAALKYWTEAMGVGPFVVLDTSVGDRHFVHRGQVSPVDFKIAFSYMGDVMIELIKPINSAPSPYSEFLGSGREGLHHIGFWPDDFDRTCAALEQSGFKEVSSICRSDGTKDVIYCDTPPAVGIMVELAQMPPVRTKFLGGIKLLADQWDGSRPIRRYADRASFIASSDCHS
jgi:catechol 2,3-dioxygenase-like lactoylglutathione lyase family enzyme